MTASSSAGLGASAGRRPIALTECDARMAVDGRRGGANPLGRASLRLQLLVAFALIALAAVLVAGAVIVQQARTATRIEISASMQLAERVARQAIAVMQQSGPTERLLASLPLQSQAPRHVRIVVTDATGQPVQPQAHIPSVDGLDGPGATGRARAPAWFAALVAPAVETRTLPVVVDGRALGSVMIVGEPGDEIAEVWEDTLALANVALLASIAVVGALYFAFGLVLRPLTGIAEGLLDLERRKDGARLPRPQVRELAAIADRFNALAQALETARTENAGLSRRLVTAQDDERRRTAMELHDEVGPCLFGLKANATSIATIAEQTKSDAGCGIKDRAGDMLAIIEDLQAINRSLLNRLRPMALGHVPLGDLLADMVRERARQHPKISMSFCAGRLAHTYGDSVDLTAYRCIQEGVTNAVRHANATHIEVEIGEIAEEAHSGEVTPRLKLAVRDDGRGIAPGAREGFGLAGMQERVQALGGFLELGNMPGGGACISVTMPAQALDRSPPNHRRAVAGE